MSTVLPLSIAKATKRSKQSWLSREGHKLEQKLSSIIHTQGVPLLISPQLLRQKGMGQVDMAIFQKQQLYLFEVKKVVSPSLAKTHSVQKRRLAKSQHFLANIFKCPTRLVWIDENFCKS